MDSRLRSSRPTFRATSTSSGTGCRQGAIFLRRCGGAIFRKGGGGTGSLGIPTVADRVAQEVARRCLEPILEPVFHADSYGYRPGKSAIDAVRQARQRCWRCDWVLDLDVRALFDSIDWELLLKAVRHHTDCPWVLLYIERWLKAPVQMEDGSVVPRTAGTPQGGVISPLLANLFLHYAFDMWMTRTYPHIPFERYADDGICHCKSAEEAQALWSELADRFAACKLVLHPEKTKIVYCKDANRRGDFPNQSLDFLGFKFRARKALGRGRRAFACFLPAASPKALTFIGRTIRRWTLHHHSDKSLQDLAETYNTYIQGWINYYGNFYRTQLRPTLKRIDLYVIRWARRKFKRLRHQTKGARDWFAQLLLQIRSSLLTGSYVMETAEQREPYESRGSRTVVCPVKASVFSRRQTCRGKRQAPRSSDSGVAGNQDSEAYRRSLPWGDYESPGRNESKR